MKSLLSRTTMLCVAFTALNAVGTAAAAAAINAQGISPESNEVSVVPA